jgi:hypothetical protein
MEPRLEAVASAENMGSSVGLRLTVLAKSLKIDNEHVCMIRYIFLYIPSTVTVMDV